MLEGKWKVIIAAVATIVLLTIVAGIINKNNTKSPSSSAIKANQTEFASISREIESNKAILLDVRTPEEFKASHFEGATNFDVQEVSQGKTPDVPKDSKIYLYCRSGNRSAQAGTILRNAGYSNIVDLGGLEHVEKIGGKLSN